LRLRQPFGRWAKSKVTASLREPAPNRPTSRPPGQYFDLRGSTEKTFKSDAEAMTARGFKVQYDNVFQNCDGTTQHQTLWMKEG
jgi:hypothetical protein